MDKIQMGLDLPPEKAKVLQSGLQNILMDFLNGIAAPSGGEEGAGAAGGAEPNPAPKQPSGGTMQKKATSTSPKEGARLQTKQGWAVFKNGKWELETK